MTGNIILAAFMVVSAVVSIPEVGATQNYTYWAYVPFPSLIQSVSWIDSSVEVYINNSAFTPVPDDDRFPAQPEEEGMHFVNWLQISTTVHWNVPGCLAYYKNWMWTIPSSSNNFYQVHMCSVAILSNS